MKRHALFVGVDQYADPTIQNLAFPTEDATALHSAFELLLKFDRAEKLLNPARRTDILDRVKSLTRGLGPGDLFFFFFAGHGFRVKENHVLVCARDEYTDLEDEYEGLAVGQLKKRMRGPWNRMIVLDACQNDIRANRGADGGVTARNLSLIHGDDEEPSSGDGAQIVVTSCAEGQKALEVADRGHGLFTSAFLDSVITFAETRQRMDLESLHKDIGGRMESLVARYRLSGRQEPLFTMPANASGIVLFDGASAVTAAVSQLPVRDSVSPMIQTEVATAAKAKAAEQKGATGTKPARQTATVRKRDGEYSENVGRRMWRYKVKNGKVAILSVSHKNSGSFCITIPTTLGGCPVTWIGAWAFDGCSDLTSITIPDSVTHIGDNAFQSCSDLTSITIPDSVTHIGDYAFYRCKSLTSITIPDSVTHVGDYAFSWCKSLTSITIPNSVTHIGVDAFSQCESLTSITIPNSVTHIGAGAFSWCKSLTSVTIPKSVTSIGSSAFIDCRCLTSIIIPGGVTSIGDIAFAECKGLRSVTIPDSVTNIGWGVFRSCGGLISISVAQGNKEYRDIDGVLFTKDGKTLVAYPGGGKGKYAIPDGVTSIAKFAFDGCDSLTSVTIPDSVTSIGEAAFCGCKQLKSVRLPGSVKQIGYQAFDQCNWSWLTKWRLKLRSWNCVCR